MTDQVVPEAATELFGLPLEEFTERRNELSARLKKEGDGEAAAAVKRLRKPRVSAWLVNQMARERGDDIAALIDLTERLKAAGSATAFRDLSAERHDVVERLVRAVPTLADGSAAAKATSAALHEVTQTLRAATAPEELDALREGTLVEPLEASGFGLPIQSEDEEEAEEIEAEPRKDPELEKLEVRLVEARAELEDKKRYADQSRRAADEAEQEVEEARRSLERLQDRIARKRSK